MIAVFEKAAQILTSLRGFDNVGPLDRGCYFPPKDRRNRRAGFRVEPAEWTTEGGFFLRALDKMLRGGDIMSEGVVR